MSSSTPSSRRPHAATAAVQARRAGHCVRLGSLLGAVLALLALPGVGHAFVRCVTTSEALTTALQDAYSTADTVSYILIAEGTYTSSDGFSLTLVNPIQGINLVGGYSRPSCATKLQGPASATVLVGTPLFPALKVRTHEPAQVQNIYIADLSLQHPGYTGSLTGACLHAENWKASHQLTIERLRIEQCQATQGAAAHVGGPGTSIVRNLLLRDNATPKAASFQAVSGGTLSLAQLTVVHGASQIGMELISAGSGSELYLSNSVVTSNAPNPFGTDIDAWHDAGSDLRLERVHVDVINGSPSSNVARSSGDPGFVSATDPHLREDSVLVDSGVPNPNGNTGTLDADGRSRVFGAAVDVGAFEYLPDALFADGFETGP
ncbi:MAG: hypothetical protein IPH76_01410 [Xanthomonadales bacterium]|nr:hypothetical protein [Xanthomonadales bacterium]